MVGYRAGEAGITHDTVAALYRIEADCTRSLTPLLQARLKMASAQPW